jgi:hypothetical protein
MSARTDFTQTSFDSSMPIGRLLAAESYGAARLRVDERRNGHDDGGR